MKTILRNFLSVLRRFKMATALNVVGLSVAFAVFLIIMMQVDYDLNFDGSHPDAERIFRMEMRIEGDTDFDWVATTPRPLVEAFIASSPHISGGTFTQRPRELFFSVDAPGGKNFYQETVCGVSPGYADVFTFDMLEGDARTLEEPDKALIPRSLAHKIFGNEAAVGRRLEGKNEAYTVGGVFRDFPRNTSTLNAVYIPVPGDENRDVWNVSGYITYIRTEPAVKVEALYENFRQAFVPAKTYTARFTPLAEVHYRTDTGLDFAPKASRRTLLLLFGIALAIVVIAGINYTNFSAALAPKRIRSINTQKVLGGDDRLIRFALLMEAVSIAFISFLAGLWMIAAMQNTFVALPIDADLSLAAHPGLIALTAGIALATGLAAGLYPARYMTSFPPAMVLKGNFGLSPSGRRLRNVLVSVQFIASFTLVIGAAFMYLQNRFMHHTSLGFRKDRVIVARINEAVEKESDAFGNQLKNFAGIEQVACAQSLLSGEQSFMVWVRTYRDEDITFRCLPVQASFLEMMDIRTTRGRGFRREDANTRYGAYIFNEKARQVYNLELNGRIGNTEIVGFMPDIKFASLHREVAPMAFYVGTVPGIFRRPFSYAYVKVKAGSDMTAAINHVRTTLKEFGNEYLSDVRFFDQVLDATYQKEQSCVTLISLFSLVAILISIVGVFGRVVFESEYRRKEISLRKIFGSTTAGILLLFNKVYLRILLLCFIVAAPVARYAVSRWLENFAYRTPLYWWVYAAAFGLVAGLTIATVTFQNWRAANANPAEGVKGE